MDWLLFRDLNTKPLDSTDYNNDQHSKERDWDGGHLDPPKHLAMQKFSSLSESGILVTGIHPIKDVFYELGDCWSFFYRMNERESNVKLEKKCVGLKRCFLSLLQLEQQTSRAVGKHNCFREQQKCKYSIIRWTLIRWTNHNSTWPETRMSQVALDWLKKKTQLVCSDYSGIADWTRQNSTKRAQEQWNCLKCTWIARKFQHLQRCLC